MNIMEKMADGEIALVIGTEKLEERRSGGRRQSLFTTGCGEYLSEPEILLDSANQQILYATPSELNFCECII